VISIIITCRKHSHSKQTFICHAITKNGFRKMNTDLPRPMSIQYIKNSIKINRLAILLQPLDNASHVVAPITHTHQFINQLIIRMASRKLRWTLGRDSERGIGALSIVRLMEVMSQSAFILVHHVRITRREGRMGAGRCISNILYSILALELLRWRLLRSNRPTISIRSCVNATSTWLRNT